VHEEPTVTAAPLEPALRAVEPAARLVSERQLRKVLNTIRESGRPIGSNPAQPYWVSADDLRAADVEVAESGAVRVVLMVDPNDRLIAHLPLPEQLRSYWRALFQAAVMGAIDAKLADGSLTAATCGERLNRLIPAAAREIQFVLEADHIANADANAADRYRLFAAVFLDRLFFAPGELERVFPSLPEPATVAAVLAEDVDAAALLARSRPAGAADPEREPPPEQQWLESAPPAESPIELPPGEPGSLLGRALDAERKGNFVRAAVLRTQAASRLAGAEQERANALARSAVGELVERLGAVLDWDEPTRQEWRQALGPLLAPASSGIWPRAARCLYELQKVPGELSREVFAVDLPEYLRTLGRRPVKRPLPFARDVLLLMHLRRAHQQLLRVTVGERERFRLDRLLHHEMHRADHAIRHAQTPVITAALTEAGFRPANRVEEVARDKAVAELLDRVCERGYLRFGDLRDAVARNQLKMPDLRGPGEFVRGDPLLQADARLAYALDGVYRKGEFYLRLIQRFSSVFFGTPLGRLFMLYVALPFGGAFLTLMFMEELRHIGSIGYAFASRILAPKPPPAPPTLPAPGKPPAPVIEFEDDEETDPIITFDPEQALEIVSSTFTSTSARGEPHHASPLISWPVIVGFGVLLLLMFHVPPFRRVVFALLGDLWLAVRMVLHDLPLAVWRSPPVKAVRDSQAVGFVNRYLSGAIIATAIVVVVLSFLGASPGRLLRWGGIVFAVVALLSNTRLGWVVQERLAERLSDWWRVVRVNMLPGLVSWIIGGFRWLANWIERRLYAVDEWLRFRSGDSQGSLALKAFLGLLWFPIAYLTRFVFYLLVEPQVNPVKHFPVVTVSHKVIWPMVPQLVEMTGFSPWTVGMVVNGIPGIFGFMAWELMANWRLYAANRSDRLRPVMVGSHGESMRGLLRPGFHSGTVPKLFRKLRRAKPERVPRYQDEVEHVAEAVHRFVERELVPLLEGSPDWSGLKIEVGHVWFGCQRVVVEIHCPELGRDPLLLAFENRCGRVEASVPRAGWFETLTGPRREVFVAAGRGLLDMAAAELFDGAERSPPPRPTPLDPAGPLAELRGAYEWPKWVDRWQTPITKG
jgi:hypothetical protein